MQWRVEDTKKVLEKAISKLEYRKKLDDFSRCEVMELMEELFCVESFDRFEKSFLNLVDTFLMSDREMIDCEKIQVYVYL